MQEELTYEQAMERLEALASKMERSEIGIDEMAMKLQEAQTLMQFCKERLYESEKNCNSLLQMEEKV
ncbi:MAG: exodeoxyribonuclease VII small subunit [Bacteroidaceae bacterium]|jgi:exodeoxyribonuclease VII small subunit|nr:exodeoxyribonuclease VII small subunit [Bacteroidaceae bacterium]MBR6170382.1 exodeoxyribonuclease VII small subunit [Bacteroidaceae bacterium]